MSRGAVARARGCPKRREAFSLRFLGIGVKVLEKILMPDADAVFAQMMLLREKTTCKWRLSCRFIVFSGKGAMAGITCEKCR
ncbi:hypothetical protein [uncultured Bilophila sp.]|uniref:hypothetical protein n=1 Tax=uncultured Bilophila sp. TaxID=529385 RepID=UPI00280ABF93|nr:hypothetical protein [uncultured Bilophila sp.]